MKAVSEVVFVVAYMSSPFVVLYFVIRVSAAKTRRSQPLVVSGHGVKPVPKEMRVGAWVNFVSATWPLVRLVYDADVLTLSFGITGPTVIKREEVLSVEKVIGFFGSGLVFRTEDGRFDRVVVWPLGPVLREQLDSLGWPMGQRGPRRRKKALADA